MEDSQLVDGEQKYHPGYGVVKQGCPWEEFGTALNIVGS